MTLDTQQLKAAERRERDAMIEKHGSYAAWYKHIGHAYLSHLELFYCQRFMRAGANMHFLDAGCGDGRLTLALARSQQRWTSVDYSEKSIAVMQHQLQRLQIPPARIEARCADIAERLLPAASVDRVICIQALQHLPSTQQQQQTLNHFHEYLNPGGRLLLSVYRWWQGSEPQNGIMTGNVGQIHYTKFLPDDLTSMLRHAGFVRVRIYPMKVALNYKNWVIRYSSWGKFGVWFDYATALCLNPRRYGGYLFAVADKGADA